MCGGSSARLRTAGIGGLAAEPAGRGSRDGIDSAVLEAGMDGAGNTFSVALGASMIDQRSPGPEGLPGCVALCGAAAGLRPDAQLCTRPRTEGLADAVTDASPTDTTAGAGAQSNGVCLRGWTDQTSQ